MSTSSTNIAPLELITALVYIKVVVVIWVTSVIHFRAVEITCGLQEACRYQQIHLRDISNTRRAS